MKTNQRVMLDDDSELIILDKMLGTTSNKSFVNGSSDLIIFSIDIKSNDESQS